MSASPSNSGHAQSGHQCLLRATSGHCGVQTPGDITPKGKYDMTTFDEVLVKASSDFMDKAKADGKPFFIWHNTTRMHVWTFLSPKYKALMTNETNYGPEEAGMAQMDDSIGALLKHLDDIGEANNTIVVFTTDNGAEVFTWPDGGMTPFKHTKGTVSEGGFRVPAIIRWPGKVKPGTVENGIMSDLDWFPTLLTAAGKPGIKDQLLKGIDLGGRTYKNHLDGYDQTALITGSGPSARSALFYFGGAQLGADSTRRYEVHLLPAAGRLARSENDDGHADPRQPPARPIRANAYAARRNKRDRRLGLRQRVFWPRGLALRCCPKGRPGLGKDGGGVPADAGPGVLQSGGCKGAGRCPD